MSDARNIGKHSQTMGAYSLVKDYNKTNLTIDDIYSLIIYFGPEKDMNPEAAKLIYDYLVNFFGKESAIFTLICSDWKYLKSFLNFSGICPFCGCVKKCFSSHIDLKAKEKNCECDLAKDKIGSKLHQKYKDDNLDFDIERWRVIIETLHCTLRTSEHAISIAVYFAVSLGAKLEDINKWIKEKVFNGKNMMVIEFETDKKENHVSIFNYSFKILHAKEVEKLAFIKKIPDFYDEFMKLKVDEHFVSNNQINQFFYEILYSQRIALFLGAIEEHKRRNIKFGENVKNSNNFFNVVDKILDKLFSESKENKPSIFFGNLFKYYSEYLLLITTFMKEGIPSQDLHENFEKLLEEILKKRRGSKLTKKEKEELSEKLSHKFFYFSFDNQHEVKNKIQELIFNIWKELGADDLDIEEGLDLLDYIIQDWCLVAKFISFYMKGYYGKRKKIEIKKTQKK